MSDRDKVIEYLETRKKNALALRRMCCVSGDSKGVTRCSFHVEFINSMLNDISIGVIEWGQS